MKKKILSVVLAVAMAGTMLAGCGAKKEAKNKNSITVLVESGSPAGGTCKRNSSIF